jgi:hypothetical protein
MIHSMETVNVLLDDMLITSVALEENPSHPLAREACWQQHETKVSASLSNETLNLQVVCKGESVLVFVGRVVAPITFNCKLAESKRLTLSFQ